MDVTHMLFRNWISFLLRNHIDEDVAKSKWRDPNEETQGVFE